MLNNQFNESPEYKVSYYGLIHFFPKSYCRVTKFQGHKGLQHALIPPALSMGHLKKAHGILLLIYSILTARDPPWNTSSHIHRCWLDLCLKISGDWGHLISLLGSRPHQIFKQSSF